MKINALLLCSIGSDATSYYRGVVPFKVLEKQVERLTVTVFPDDQVPDANRLRCADVLILQRPTSPNHVNIMIDAKELGIPCWVDYDDNVTAMPESNPMTKHYMKNGTFNVVKECLKMADAVTVTTGALKEAFAELNQNIFVIPNAFDDAFLHSKKPYGGKPEGAKKTVLWRGGGGHDHDLIKVVGSLKRHHEKHPDWHWVFFGFNPWMLTEELPKESYNHVEWGSMIAYFKTINTLQPDLVIVPLIDTPFNRCRSNTAFMEASYANAAVLAPNFEQWDMPGVCNYRDSKGFHDGLNFMMGEGRLGERAARGWEYVKGNLLLSQVNLLRWNLFQKLDIQKPEQIPPKRLVVNDSLVLDGVNIQPGVIDVVSN